MQDFKFFPTSLCGCSCFSSLLIFFLLLLPHCHTQHCHTLLIHTQHCQTQHCHIEHCHMTILSHTTFTPLALSYSCFTTLHLSHVCNRDTTLRFAPSVLSSHSSCFVSDFNVTFFEYFLILLDVLFQICFKKSRWYSDLSAFLTSTCKRSSDPTAWSTS